MTPEEEATFYAMLKGLALVFIPAGIFVFGLIYLVSPPPRPLSQSWANGTYVNDCCPPLVLRNGLLTMGTKTARYVVSKSKLGFGIDVAEGIGIRGDHIETGSPFVYVFFNEISAAAPALGEAKSLQLIDLQREDHVTFTKRE